jgi:hypothetical protein
LALIASIATEFTRKAIPVITIAPRAALIFADPSFRQIVHVATDTPEKSANNIAGVSTYASLHDIPFRSQRVFTE